MSNKAIKKTGILRTAHAPKSLNKPIKSDNTDEAVPSVQSNRAETYENSAVNANPLNKKDIYLYTFFFITACYPLTFGAIGNFSNILWIEMLAPIVVLLSLLKIMKMSKQLFPVGSRFSAYAIILLILCSIGHFIFHPVGSQNLVSGSSVAGGIRAYFGIFVCASVFFSTLWITAYKFKHDTDWKTLLKIFLWVSLFIGYSRLITYLAGIEMPIMAGVFGYNEEAYLAGGAHRIGGLSECATLGLAALLALNWSVKWTVKNYAILFSILFLMVMSGGRASIVAVFIALVTYFVILRKEYGKAIIFILLLLAAALIALQYDIFTTQYERLSNIEGGIESNKAGRGVIYAEMWRIFLAHPIFGKGIGAQYVSPNLPEFIKQQVVMGGHGAYMSILSLYGFVGVIHIIANLFAPIRNGIKNLRNRRLTYMKDSGLFAMTVFVVIALIILSVEFIVGGNGYNFHRLYLYSGLMAGVLVNFRSIAKQHKLSNSK